MPQTVEVNGVVYRTGPEDAIDISIPLRFDGPQPNAFGVDPATSTACEYGTLIGDTRRGGSCNFERVTLVPHCNGTHTECVGHITNERISVRECLQDALIPCVLITMRPEPSANGDPVLTAARLDGAFERAGGHTAGPKGLIVRTLPNDDDKLSRVYDENNIPPYFAWDAMERIVQLGIKHLVVDLPSIDRLFDGGRLLNHRIFWNCGADASSITDATRQDSTITELVYVPESVPDGPYLLNLQIAPFEADAAPSRPILFPVQTTPKRGPKGGEGARVLNPASGPGGGIGATRSIAKRKAVNAISRRVRERS